MTDIWKTRATLLQRAQDKSNHQAWDEFVTFYSPYITIVLKKMGLFNESEDITQEILLKIWKYLQTYDPDKHKTQFRTWLSKIIRNTSITFLQKKHKEPHTVSSDEDSGQDILDNIPIQDDLEEVINREWQLHLTQTALTRIKTHFSENAILSFEQSLNGMTTKEISDALDITQASVRTLKNRVKDRMLEEIKLLRNQMEIS